MKTKLRECPTCHTQQFDGECAHCATKAERAMTPKTAVHEELMQAAKDVVLCQGKYEINRLANIISKINSEDSL